MIQTLHEQVARERRRDVPKGSDYASPQYPESEPRPSLVGIIGAGAHAAGIAEDLSGADENGERGRERKAHRPVESRGKRHAADCAEPSFPREGVMACPASGS